MLDLYASVAGVFFCLKKDNLDFDLSGEFSIKNNLKDVMLALN